MMQTRQIHFAGSTLTIEFSGAQAARVIEHLYRHVPAGPPGLSQLTYRLLDDDIAEEWQLHRDDTLLYQGNCRGTVAELLLGDSCNQLAANSRTGLLFHAAALSWQRRGFILPGATGAGKSTLTAWLIGQGFDYMTDELAFVPWQANSIETFTRPINLKRPARAALSGIFNFEKQAARILNSPYVDLVPPTLLYPTHPQNRGPLNLIIFPCYQANHPFELRQLSKAQAGLALMQTLINARNLPGHGFSEITRLVRHIPAYTMRYSRFDGIDHHLRNLLVTPEVRATWP